MYLAHQYTAEYPASEYPASTEPRPAHPPASDTARHWFIMAVANIPVYAYTTTSGRIFVTWIPALDPDRAPTDLQRQHLDALTPVTDIDLDRACLPMTPVVRDYLTAFLRHKPLPPPGRDPVDVPQDAPVLGFVVDRDGVKVPAVRVASHEGQAGVLRMDSEAAGTSLRWAWLPTSQFAPTASGFAQSTEHLTDFDFVRPWAESAPLVAIQGVAALLKAPTRRLSNMALLCVLEDILEPIPPDHRAHATGEALARQLEHRCGIHRGESTRHYGESLSIIRQVLRDLQEAQVRLSPRAFTRTISEPAGQVVLQLLSQHLRQVLVLDGMAQQGTGHLKGTIHRLTQRITDPYTLSLTATVPRMASAFASLASRRWDMGESEDAVSRYVRELCFLLGTNLPFWKQSYEQSLLEQYLSLWE